MTELKHCPFCGGEARADEECSGTWKIRCKKCSCDVGRYCFSTKEQAIEAWNKRAGDGAGMTHDVEDISGAEVSAYQYELTFYPRMIPITNPDVEWR